MYNMEWSEKREERCMRQRGHLNIRAVKEMLKKGCRTTPDYSRVSCMRGRQVNPTTGPNKFV